MLVVKQKSNTKKKKCKPSSMNRQFGCQRNTYNRHQNAGSNYNRSKSSTNYNQLNNSSSSTRTNYSDLNRNSFNQNAISNTGYMTDELRSVIEKYILENQKVTCVIFVVSVNCQVIDKY